MTVARRQHRPDQARRFRTRRAMSIQLGHIANSSRDHGRHRTTSALYVTFTKFDGGLAASLPVQN
jgi:hypothetical protein